MKAVPQHPRAATQLGRIETIERRLDYVDEALEPMQTQLKEIHDLLFGAKAILWFLTKVCGWTGGGVAVAGTIVLIWKALHSGP